MSNSGSKPKQHFLPLLIVYMLCNWITRTLALTLLRVWLSVQPPNLTQTVWCPSLSALRTLKHISKVFVLEMEGYAWTGWFVPLWQRWSFLQNLRLKGSTVAFWNSSVYHISFLIQNKNSKIISYGSEEAAGFTVLKELILEIMILLCSHCIYIDLWSRQDPLPIAFDCLQNTFTFPISLDSHVSPLKWLLLSVFNRWGK